VVRKVRSKWYQPVCGDDRGDRNLTPEALAAEVERRNRYWFEHYEDFRCDVVVRHDHAGSSIGLFDQFSGGLGIFGSFPTRSMAPRWERRMNKPFSVKFDGTPAGLRIAQEQQAAWAAMQAEKELVRRAATRPALRIPPRPPSRLAALAAQQRRTAKSSKTARGARSLPSAPTPSSPAGRRAANTQTAASVLADACKAYEEGRFPAALARFRRLANGSILADEGHFGLACLAVRGGDLAASRSHLIRALALNPAHKNAKAALIKVERRLAAR
jgi:hypothetical protein